MCIAPYICVLLIDCVISSFMRCFCSSCSPIYVYDLSSVCYVIRLSVLMISLRINVIRAVSALRVSLLDVVDSACSQCIMLWVMRCVIRRRGIRC